jgi:hypothetical protein
VIDANEMCFFVVYDHGSQTAPWDEDNGFYGIMVGINIDWF